MRESATNMRTHSSVPFCRSHRYIPSLALICTIAVSVSGCDFYSLDDVEPNDSIPYTEAITDLASARNARAGIYDRLQMTNSFDGYLAAWQYFSDEADFSGTFPTRAEFDIYNVLPSNNTLSGFYTDFYEISNASNSFLANLAIAEDISLTESNRASLQGEARFARALAYFYLTQGWVDVPLVLEPTIEAGEQLAINATSQNDVYDQIETDLDFAASNIDADITLTITVAAAQGLHARVALYRGQYDEAYALATSALGGEDFDLTSELYLEDDLFEIEYSPIDGNSFAFFYGLPSLNGRYSIHPSDSLIAAFEPGDARFAATMDTVGGRPYGVKYDNFQAANGSQDDPLHVIRASEMVLIAAEAAAAQGDFDLAEQWLNQVRTRAGLKPIEDLDVDNYIDAILQERFVELSLEGGHRLWDLRRTGRAEEVLGAGGYDSCDDRWPLPQREIDRNPNLEKNSACNS